MSYDPKKVIALAKSEVGYLEKASNSNLDNPTANAGSKNYTKYARDLDKIAGFYNGRKQSVAWCDIFVDWLFVTAYGLDAAYKLLCQPTKSCGAGCKYSRNYYKKKGQLHDSPLPGDQIFFYPSDRSDPNVIQHTGLVVAVDKTYVYTIEGNTSGASGVIANGGGVCEKKYKLTNKRLAGYGRPNYGVEYETETKPEVVKVYALGDRPLSYNTPYMEGVDVSAMQTALNALGYACGTVDGIFGRKTEAGVIAFLKAVGLNPDGIFDAEALGKLNALRNGTAVPVVNDPTLRTYTVQRGDRLWNIAKKLLGSGNKYHLIMDVNGLKSTVIHAGKVLKIPNA